MLSALYHRGETKEMTPDLETIMRDPAWLPHRLTDGGRRLVFVEADRDAHRAATFLDDASLGDQRRRVDAATIDVARVMSEPSAAPHFIFHSAFARSTLLARAMDLPGFAMGLKEPIILNDAAQLLRERRLGQDTLAVAMHLLARPLSRDEAVIVKPSNIANLLMPELLRLRPGSRALILYRDLPSYLRSIARKGMFGRIWARQLLFTIQGEALFDAGFSDRDRFGQTDLQAAAIGWLIQHAQFAALTMAIPDRVRVLDASALVTDPRDTFAAICAWFGLALDPGAVEAVVVGPAFAGDSKRIGERFRGDRDEGAPFDPREIEMVVQWAEAVAAHVGVPLHFGPRLVA
jgi:hypothetical protein